MKGFSGTWILMIVLLLGQLGCGGGADQPHVAQISGTVTYNGQPLPQGTISFFPTGGRTGTGTIKDGKISDVTTFLLNDGVIVGSHRVSIAAVEKNPSDAMAPGKWLIPERYGAPETSGLTAEAKAGQNTELKFDLKD